MNIIKKSLRRIIQWCGFNVIRFDPKRIGVDPFADMQRFLKGCNHPVILDVGANIGQSVHKFRDVFQAPIIHSFEPSPSTYAELESHCGKLPGVDTWNLGVGSNDATLLFQENESPTMSSFLTPSDFCWGKVLKSTSVQVTTLDSFAKKHGIEYIHILKSDTQGFDFEVFKGASRLMEENRIALIYFEFIFSDMYKDLPSFHDVSRYLCEHNFSLVTFYESHFQEGLVSWTDVMFVNNEFNQRCSKQGKAY